MPVYNKLIRDNVPDIIRRNGGFPVTHIATRGEYRKALRAKLQEEVAEFLESNSVEELADVLEVVYALGEMLGGFSPAQLEAWRDRKAALNGTFSEHIILDEVRESRPEE